jgi:hypothetical protein
VRELCGSCHPGTSPGPQPSRPPATGEIQLEGARGILEAFFTQVDTKE